MAQVRADIDTNVLVRFLTRDDPSQARIASKLIRQGARIQMIALVETEWVLRKAYGWKKSTVAKAFETLLRYANIVVEERDRVSEALAHWRVSPQADFADCMLVAGAERTFATFDQGLATLPGVRLL